MKKHSVLLAMLFVLLAVTSSQAWDDDDYRIEAGIGYASSEVDSDYLNESVDIGAGPAIALNFWKDGAFDIPMLSAGVGYKYHYAEKSIDTGVYSGSAEIYEHDLLLKLALRNNDFRADIHPYIGAGIGLSYLSTDISDETSTGHTLSGFLGFDYDIPKTNYYIGLETSYTRTWSEVYSTDFTVDTINGILKFGVHF